MSEKINLIEELEGDRRYDSLDDYLENRDRSNSLNLLTGLNYDSEIPVESLYQVAAINEVINQASSSQGYEANGQIVITDSFNGSSEEATKAVEKTVNSYLSQHMSDDAEIEVVRSSDLEATETFEQNHRDIRKAVGENQELAASMLNTIPEHVRTYESFDAYSTQELLQDLDYLIRQEAIIASNDTSIKFGPTTEKPFDQIYREIPNLGELVGAYVPQAIDIEGREVTNYRSRNGSSEPSDRILVTDNQREITKKVRKMDPEDMEGLFKFASTISGAEVEDEKKLISVLNNHIPPLNPNNRSSLYNHGG